MKSAKRSRLFVCLVVMLILGSLWGTNAQANSAVSESPSSLSFGSVSVNTLSAPQAFTVMNMGSHKIIIESVASSSNQFTVTGPSLPLTVNPGQGASFQVVFEPTTVGTSSGTIQVSLNGYSRGVQSVAVSGTGLANAQDPPPPVSPSITSLNPNSGAVGTLVTITGKNFGATQGTITFNGTVATPTSWSATSIVAPVPAGATTGNVVVTVGGVASTGVSFTVGSVAPLAFVQVNFATPQAPQTTVAVTYTQAQTAGDLNVVVVGWNDSVAKINSVTDSKGNAYSLAVGPTVQSGTATQAIYYAKNIAAAAANSNTVTVTFNTGAAFPDIRVAEYSGIDTTTPVDVVAAAQGNGTPSNSGSVTTGNANDLLVGANLVQQTTTGPGSGYTSRVITTPDSDILEDSIVTTAGSRSATAPITGGAWIMQMVAFRGAGSGAGTSPSVTSLNPSSGAVGTSVAVAGTNFGATQGASTITFNGTVATPTSWSATSIVAPVPASATTGNVVVTVGGQASNGSSFTVTTALPGEPTLIQHVSSSNTRNNGFASPFCYYFQLPNPTTSGNAVIVGFTFNSNPTPTVTDDKGDSYTMVENYYDTADSQSVAIAAAFNVSSGARNISVCFSSSPGGYVQPMATEFNNVIAVDGSGTGSHGTGTLVTAGNLTPAVSGDLAYQVVFSLSVSQSSFTAGSQGNITWNLLSADLRDGWAGQYGVYDSTSAINPTMSMGTSQKWVSAAILLQTGASGSVPAGMRIVHLQHESICGVATCGSSFPNPLSLQFPSTGNLLVALSGGGNPSCTMSSLTDSDSNAWAQAGFTYQATSGGDDTVQVYFAGNAASSTNLSLTVKFSASTCDWSILFYDVSGAAISPLDTTNGATGDQSSTSGTLIVPYTITPAQSGELIFTNIIWDYNTATGLSSNVGTSYSDANMFSGELISGPEPVDQNNGWGHAISTSTSAITFTWDQANDTSLAAGPYASIAAAFKAADPPEN